MQYALVTKSHGSLKKFGKTLLENNFFGTFFDCLLLPVELVFLEGESHYSTVIDSIAILLIGISGLVITFD